MKAKILFFGFLSLVSLIFISLNRANNKNRTQLSSAPNLSRESGLSKKLPSAHLPNPNSLYQLNEKEIIAYLEDRSDKAKDFAMLWKVIHSGEFKGNTKNHLVSSFVFALAAEKSLTEVLEFVYERKGPGSERARYIEAAFSYSKASGRQKVAMLKQLDHEDELEGACRALSSWSTTGLDITDFDLSEPIPGAVNELLLNTLSLSVGGQIDGSKASAIENYVGVLEQKISDEVINKNSVAKFLTKASGDSPFEVWNYCSEGAEELSHSITKKQRAEILKNMILLEPQRAMERLSGKENYVGNDLVVAMGEWINLDSKTALEWFKRKDLHDVELVSDIQFSFANAALRNGEIDGALKWRDEIQGETRKEEINYQLWKVQRDKIAAETKSDPTQVFSSFLEGTSSYESYFLEEATTQWIKIAPAKAAEWVEENGSSLPENSFQYVAAAYAGASVDSNDLELARQWADLIQDEKTLTRINGIIEKAEQAASD